MFEALLLWQGAEVWSRVSNWTILRDQAAEICSARRVYDVPGGTSLRISYAARTGETTLTTANRNWTSLVTGETLPLTLSTSRWGDREVRARVFRTDTGVPGLAIRLDREFLSEFALSYGIGLLKPDGTQVIDLDLTGSHAAVLEVGECARSFGEQSGGAAANAHAPLQLG